MININRFCAVNIVLLFAVILSSSAAHADTSDKVFILQLSFDNENIMLNNISVINGSAPDRRVQPDEGYRLEEVSFSDKVLYSFKFNIPNKIMTAPHFEGFPIERIKSLEIKQGRFSLIFPYFQSAKTINIYTPDDILILEIDVSMFAENKSILSSKSKLLFFAAALSLIALAVIVAYIFHKNQKKREYILNYIEQAKSKGYSKEQIEKILADKGISIEEIKPLAERAYKPVIPKTKK